MVEMRKRTLLVALAILALGLVGTGLSTLLKQNEYIGSPPVVTVKESYGFPLIWYGYSFQEVGIPSPNPPPKTYWFSLGSLLVDGALWVAISFFVCIAAVKSVSILHKARASKNLSVTNI
jgi:hypothetical protein